MSSFFLLLSLLVLVLSASSASAQSSVSASFSTVTNTPTFPVREYAACAQSIATTTSIPTLYLYGGFNVTGSNYSTYTDNYLNDGWQSKDFGSTWTLTTAAAAFPPQGWNGAVVTQQGIVYIGGGGDSNALQNNNVYFSTDGASFSLVGAAPFDPRENAGIAGIPNSNQLLVALGNTRNDYFIDDIWISTDGQGKTWTQTCGGAGGAGSAVVCPLITNGGLNNETSQLHGPALAGLYSGTWVIMGGYGSYATTASNSTSFISNQVAYSTDGFRTFSTYTAPWSPRGQARVTVDTDSWLYLYGGVFNLPYTASPISQVYYNYYTDVWYSPNPASQSASWYSLGNVNLGTAGYNGVANNGNPNSPTAGLYTNGVIFNPCFAFGWNGGSKQLVLYSGVLQGFRGVVPQATPAWAGVYRGVVNVPTNSTPSTGGAVSMSVSLASVGVAVVAAAAALVL